MTTRNVGPASRCLALLTEGLRRWLWPSRIKLQDGRCQRKHRHCHRRRHRVYAALLGLFLVALAARLRGIGADSRVVWDETHFGRFATRYINREFYLDVHPPLGKLLLTAIYAALGYSGDFDFESGQAYPSSVPIASARCVQALLGALLAPVSVVVLHAMRLPPACAWLAGFFAALDNALIGISRIVVLDSMLLLANALSLYAFLRLKLAQKRKLRHALVFGAALGILCSIKLVGLLTLTVFNAFLIGDILVYRGTPREHMRALLRLLSALALSALVYLAAFAIQLLVFQNYTPEAEHMGSEFVARLNNSAIASQYPTIRPGSFVVLRSAHYPFEYLSAYATNSNSSSDYVLATRRRLAVEDYWQVQIPDANGTSSKTRIDYGDHISLFVPKTRFCISILDHRSVGLEHARAQRAYLGSEASKQHCTDKWQIIPDRNKDNLHDLLPVVSKFRLRAYKRSCELAVDYQRPLYDAQSMDISVPQQYLFKCVDHSRGTLWNIEHHLSTASELPVNLSPSVARSYFRDISTYNRLMHELNGMLVSDPDQLSPVESHPFSWPLLNNPMPMVQWSDAASTKYMLVGNPVLWWLSGLVCVWIHPLCLFLNLVVYRRSNGKLARIRLFSPSNLLWSLWAVHYFPFFALSRATYLHHYLPAFYFALLLLAVYLWKSLAFISCACLPGTASARGERYIMLAYALVIVSLVLVGYVFVCPLTYGITKPCEYQRYRGFKSWNTCRSP